MSPRQMVHDSILSLESRFRRYVAKRDSASANFTETGGWCIETVWDQPQIWVPVVDPRGWATNCSSTATFDTKLDPGHSDFSCDRPGGHTGRHAAYDTNFRGGHKAWRVWAVWA